jgi:hypothetical protein
MGGAHDSHGMAAEYAGRWPDFIDGPEAREMERRWPMALQELKALRMRLKDLGPANSHVLPEKVSKAARRRLIKGLAQAIMQEDRPGLKRSVARRMADKIGDYLLWRRETSVPVIHELVVLLPWWISHMPGAVIPRIRDIGLNYILNGSVVPLQMAWKDILNADPVFMGHCACRSAGVVDDLKQNGEVFSLVGEAEGRRLLDRFLDRYQELKLANGYVPDTDALYMKLCEDLAAMRASGSSDYRIETLLARTYSSWEILPIHEKYTSAWVRSLHRNHKAHLLNKELAFELANIFYLARGTIFSSMKLFDTPYTICSCPTPETGGGCTLTNWYYRGGSNASLLPNEAFFGRRRDAAGNLMACRYFPERAGRDCIGCGCFHEAAEPRHPDVILEQADRVLATYREHGHIE